MVMPFKIISISFAEATETVNNDAYLGSNAVGQNFHTISDQQTRPRRVVETVINEDEGNFRNPSGRDFGLCKLGGANGPYDV